MGLRDFFSPGAWNALCDVCSQKRKSYELKKRWDGVMACKNCWEPRQSQDFVRGIVDDMSTPWTRPDPEPTFIDPSVRPEDVL